MKKDVNWVADDAGLSALDELGIEYSHALIDVESIDRKASAENRARKYPLDDSRIEGIKNAMLRGIPIPKIIVRKRRDGSYVIVGGNHRFNSLDAESSTIPVHIVTCTDTEFEIACKVLNTVVGVGLSRQERIDAAIDATDRLGVSRALACRIYGVSETVVAECSKHRQVLVRLSGVSPRVRDCFTQSHAKILGDLAKNDNILRAAANLVAMRKLTTKDLHEIAKEARAQTTEAGQVTVFESAAKMHESESNKLVPRKIKRQFLISCTHIKNLKGHETWESLEFRPDEIADAKKIAKDAASILSYLCRVDG